MRDNLYFIVVGPSLPLLHFCLDEVLGRGGLVFNHSIGASSACPRFLVELFAETVDQGYVLLFRDGFVVSGEGFGSGVLNTQAFGDLHRPSFTSLRFPF